MNEDSTTEADIENKPVVSTGKKEAGGARGEMGLRSTNNHI